MVFDIGLIGTTTVGDFYFVFGKTQIQNFSKSKI